MIYRLILFFIIFTLIIALINFYIYRRLIKPFKIPRLCKRMLWIYMLLTPMLTPLTFMLRFAGLDIFGSAGIAWFTYINLGFFSLVLALLLLRDLAWGVQSIYNSLGRRWSGRRKNNSAASPIRTYSPSRRQFLMNSVNLGIFGAAGILSGYGFYEARRQPVLKEIEIPIANLPAELLNFRIAQFSDVHAGPMIKRRFVESVVNQINQLRPDLIVCTGDMVDGSVAELKNDVEVLKDLYAPAGVFFVTGNHEYYSGAEPWIDELQRLGLTVLLNDHRLLGRQNNKIVIAGVPDYTADQFIAAHVCDPHLALRGAEAVPVKILLAHQPRSIFAAAAAGYHLQISGHTHGGQYLPWKYLVTLSQPYVAGLHRHEHTWIYVNRGAGYWGPPLRLGVPSEVTLFKLVSAS